MSRLSTRDLAVAIVVVAIWGTNFAVIRVALDHLPPLLFAALRFAFAVVPAIFFVRRPNASWASITAFGLVSGCGQFGLLYTAMQGHISPGLASLVIQMQVVFTVCIAVPLAHERLRAYQVLALAVAAAGIVVIALHVDRTTTPAGLALVLLAAFCWAASNLIIKRSGATNMLAYIVWSSLFAAPPLLVLSLATEGWPAIMQGLARADAATWGAVAWQSIGNTLFCFAIWGVLLARYPAATVTPFALLVPVFAMGASALWLGEPLPFWKLGAACLILAGLAINMLYPRRIA